MKINLGDVPKITEIKYGDIVVTKEDNKYLIIADDDGFSYRALNLGTYIPTDYSSTIGTLFQYEVQEEISYVVKSENIELRKC